MLLDLLWLKQYTRNVLTCILFIPEPAKLTVCYDEVIMLHSTDFKKTEFGAENDVAVELTDVIMAVFYF